MYRLVNGERVENLSFHHEPGTPWECSQWYRDENTGKLIQQLYNSETGGVKNRRRKGPRGLTGPNNGKRYGEKSPAFSCPHTSPR